MKTLEWLLVYIFTKPSKRSEQMRLDWDWFWKIDVTYWWFTTPIYRAFQQCTHWTLAHVRHKDESSDDEYPF